MQHKGNGATEALLDQRAASLARRLLAGAGIASITGYHLPGRPALDAIAHGFTSRGELVIGAVLDEQHEMRGGDEPLSVRLEIALHSPELQLRVLAASAHLLADLTWLTPHEAAAHLGTLPTAVADLATTPDALVGVLDADRVLLHGGGGVHAYGLAHMGQRHRDAGDIPLGDLDELAFEFVTSAPRDDLGRVFEAAEGELIPSQELMRQPIAATCQHVLNRVFWVDVDADGVTLLRMGAEETVVLFVPFAIPAASASHLRCAVAELLQRDFGVEAALTEERFSALLGD